MAEEPGNMKQGDDEVTDVKEIGGELTAEKITGGAASEAEGDSKVADAPAKENSENSEESVTESKDEKIGNASIQTKPANRHKFSRTRSEPPKSTYIVSASGSRRGRDFSSSDDISRKTLTSIDEDSDAYKPRRKHTLEIVRRNTTFTETDLSEHSERRSRHTEAEYLQSREAIL